jgi:hypothetical protein
VKREPPVATLAAREVDALRRELERRAEGFAASPRWNADPADVQRSVAKLVLTLVEFLRKLLERQAIRRMERGTLTDEETENVGLALMRLEETIHSIAKSFGVDPSELNLELGPLGRLI